MSRYASVHVSTEHFTYEADRKMFIAEASDLPISGLGRVYEDAVDTGLVLVSSRTGKEITFVVADVETRCGDIMAWSLTSTTGGFKMTIFND